MLPPAGLSAHGHQDRAHLNQDHRDQHNKQGIACNFRRRQCAATSVSLRLIPTETIKKNTILGSKYFIYSPPGSLVSFWMQIFRFDPPVEAQREFNVNMSYHAAELAARASR